MQKEAERNITGIFDVDLCSRESDRYFMYEKVYMVFRRKLEFTVRIVDKMYENSKINYSRE